VREKVSWQYAKSQANQNGGHLLRIDSFAEHDFIKKYLLALSPSFKHVFIDGDRHLDLKTWRYGNKEKVDFTKMRRLPRFVPASGQSSIDVHLCLYEPIGWHVEDLGPVDLGNFIIEWDN